MTKAPRLLSRRELVAGLVAAPALAAMLKTARAQSAGVPHPRFCYLYWGNGAHPDWTPPEGPDGTFGTLTAPMQPLEAIRQDIVILKNLMLLYPGDVSHS